MSPSVNFLEILGTDTEFESKNAHVDSESYLVACPNGGLGRGRRCFGFRPRLLRHEAPAQCLLGLSNEVFVSAWAAGKCTLSDSLLDSAFISCCQPLFPILNLVWGDPYAIEQGILAEATVGCSAGPRIIFSVSHHPRPHWIAFDITDRSPKVLFIQCTRKWTSLPQMAAESVLHIEPGRVQTMTSVKRPPHRVRSLRNGDEVYVIAHQAIRADP